MHLWLVARRDRSWLWGCLGFETRPRCISSLISAFEVYVLSIQKTGKDPQNYQKIGGHGSLKDIGNDRTIERTWFRIRFPYLYTFSYRYCELRHTYWLKIATFFHPIYVQLVAPTGVAPVKFRTKFVGVRESALLPLLRARRYRSLHSSDNGHTVTECFLPIHFREHFQEMCIAVLLLGLKLKVHHLAKCG